MEVRVVREGDKYVLYLGKKRLFESSSRPSRTFSPDKKRLLVLLNAENIASVVSLPDGKEVLKIPLDNVYGIEYARSSDGKQMAAVVNRKDMKSEVYFISEGKITKREYDKLVSIKRTEKEFEIVDYEE